MDKKLKICFAASSGGHLEELMMLKPLMETYDSFIVTEKTPYISNTQNIKTYYLKQVNRREKLVGVWLILNSILSLQIFMKEKPDAIICTGVLATLPLCVICKIFRKKIIYIESFAKVTSGNLSGKFVYKFADRFYVQWKSMLEVYPRALYLGGIF